MDHKVLSLKPLGFLPALHAASLVLLSLLAVSCLVSCGPVKNGGDAQRPSVPLLRQPASPVRNPFVHLIGYSDPRNRIEVYVNRKRVATAVSDDDGRFEITRLALEPGENVITAVATDWEGRKSKSTISGKGIKKGISSATAPQVTVVYEE